MKFVLLISALATLVASQDETILVQVIVRHGSKVPDTIDPYQQLWDGYAPLSPGQTSPLGEQQFRTLGSLLRQRYIVDEPLLPPTFDQNTMMIRSSSLNDRPLRSVEALVQTLYPGAPIPVYTEDPNEDTLITTVVTCPSYVAHYPRAFETAAVEWARLYPDLLEQLGTVVGYGPERVPLFNPLNPADQCFYEECLPYALFWIAEEIMCQIDEGFLGVLDPFVQDNYELIVSLWANLEFDLVSMAGDLDPRGPSWGSLGRQILANMEAALDGSSENKLYIYPAHSLMMVQLWDLFGIGRMDPWYGDGMLVELKRRQDTGEYYVQAQRIFPTRNDGSTYNTPVEQIRCPQFQDQCSLDDFFAYFGNRSRQMAPDEGCCHVGADFFLLGCDDYLNPETVNINECFLYRKFCPQVACDVGQVVDSATFQCVPVA